jgi:hypothetical protein
MIKAPTQSIDFIARKNKETVQTCRLKMVHWRGGPRTSPAATNSMDLRIAEQCVFVIGADKPTLATFNSINRINFAPRKPPPSHEIEIKNLQ